MYDPFEATDINDLTATSLARLSGVSEGWFVEYKREPCTPKDYAKEASAFANSHGGWIFVGLDEDKATRTPAGGPGLPSKDASRFIDSARDSIYQHLSPSPQLEFAFVDGPIPELGITQGQGVLVIYVPESVDTPHIHSNGKVYRRNADAAKPEETTNRAELDELYRRRKRHSELLEEELNLGFDEQWATEISFPWVHVALVPERPRTRRSRIGIASFREALREGKEDLDKIKLSLPDTYTTSLGYVGRNTREQESIHSITTTLEYSHTGAFYVTFSLPWASAPCEDSVPFLATTQGAEFVRLLRARGLGEAAIMNGSELGIVMQGLSNHIGTLIEKFGTAGRFYSRIKIRNVLKCVPFFESQRYVESCRTHAIPMVHRGEIDIPWGTRRWLVVDEFGDEASFFGLAFIHLMGALGLGDDVELDVATEATTSTVERLSRRQMSGD